MEMTPRKYAYQDSIVAIDDHCLKLNGFVMPFTTSVTIDFLEIEEIEAVRLKGLRRFNMLGTQDLKTWWVFDPLRVIKKYGFVVKYSHSRFHIGFSPNNFDEAYRALSAGVGPKLHDRRW